VTVKEGINLPRYPSLPGRIKAKKKEITRRQPAAPAAALETVRLRVPQEQQSEARILGHGADAAPAVVDLLEQMGIGTR
jgi:electron transfer flavoprotein beta subunit